MSKNKILDLPKDYKKIRSRIINRIKYEVNSRKTFYPEDFKNIHPSDMINNIIFFEAFEEGKKYKKSKKGV